MSAPWFQRDPLRLTSQGNNNGSAMAGLTGNTSFYNIIGAIDMLIGRFGIMIPRSRWEVSWRRRMLCPRASYVPYR